MKTQLELYKQWAPDTAEWTQWAKPVVFMNIRDKELFHQKRVPNLATSTITYQSDRMVIVELAEEKSILAGLELAEKGYRPVPLYNGVPGNATAVVPMNHLIDGLLYGGKILDKIILSNEASPVFLLDSNRLKGKKQRPGTFDNRWCVVPQDMPSASYLKKKGIREIIVRTDRLQQDLHYILYTYQKQGILIYQCGSTGVIKPKTVVKKKKSVGFIGSCYY